MSKPHRPVFVLLLAILQFIVGGFLLAFSGLSMVHLVAGNTSATVTIHNGEQSTTFTYDTNVEMEKEAPGYKLALYGSGAVSIFLTIVMIVAAIGLLMVRAWGWWLSLAWAVLRLVYQALTLAYLWFVAMPAANRMVRVVPHDSNGVCGGLVNGNTFYHIFWGLFALAFLFYPLVFVVLLGLPPIWRAFSRGSAREEDREDYHDRRRPHEEDEEVERRQRRHSPD